MKLIAVSKFNWQSKTWEVGAILEADDVVAQRMIAEGLVKEAETIPEPEIEIAAIPKQSETKAETSGSAGDIADTPAAVPKKKRKIKKRKKS